MCSVSPSSRRFAVVPPSLRQSHLLPIDQNSFRIIVFDSIFCCSKSWSLFQQPGGNCGLRRESRGSAASIKYAILRFASYECCNYGSQPPFVPNGSLGSSKPMSNQMSAPLGNQESNKVETSDGHLHQAELVRYQSLALAKFSEVAENMRSPRSGSNTPRLGHTYFDPHPMVTEAWECLRKSVVKFKGHMVGTIAALDQASDALNYNQVFVRDFVPSALAFLMNDETEIVKNFLLKTLHFQASEKRIDCFTLAQGVMPASFKVLYNPTRGCDVLVADFGETAIGRVAPVDSGFWWIFLLRAYTKATGDYSLSQMPECQTGIKMILSLCLAEGFDTFPTLLCADGCCMIDRRMGIYGYPIEIQALFVMALRCAHQLLRVEGDGKEFIKLIDNRLPALIYHMRSYYWLDFKQLNNIYRFKTEEYSNTAVNKFNVIPESIPNWIFDFMPMKGGYFVGNVSPARMDFRWFALGNCMAILCSLTTDEQSVAIMDLIEERWQDLVGEMPMKAMYPALDAHEWRIVTGCDPKNTHWSYHNGGSWPVLLWLLTAACVKTGRPQIARRALELAECSLSKDGWPEYYDGKDGNYIGKQSRKMQTWSIAGYLVAKMLLEDPSHLGMMALEEDKKMKPMLTRATTMPTKLHPYY